MAEPLGQVALEPSGEEVDVIELILGERKDMECRQELDRVGRLNRVSRTIHNPIGTKLARNILTKRVTGPLGSRPPIPPTVTGPLGSRPPIPPTVTGPLGSRPPIPPTVTGPLGSRPPIPPTVTGPLGSRPPIPPTLPEEKEAHHRRHSSEEDYQQRLALMHAIKESRNEELDTLRRRGVVQKRLADRRMRSRAKRMFNQRIYVNPKSKKRPSKSSILVTGIEGEEADRSVEYIRQESQMYIGSFIKMPSKNRRVLQRLNSNQLSGIKNSEMRKTNRRMFGHLPFDEADGDLSFEMLRNGQEGAEVTPHQEGSNAQTLPNVSNLENINSNTVLESNLPVQDSASAGHSKGAEPSKTERLKNKFRNGLKKIPEATNKLLSRKKKGGISKSSKKGKSRKTRHVSSSMDELVDDVHVKPRKKSLERKRYYSTRKVRSKALEVDQTSSVVSHSQFHKRAGAPPPPPPAAAPKGPLSPMGTSKNWPPLSSMSHDGHMTPCAATLQKSYSQSIQSQDSLTQSHDVVTGSHDSQPIPPYKKTTSSSFDAEVAGGPPSPYTLSQTQPNDSLGNGAYQPSTKTVSTDEPQSSSAVDGHMTNGFSSSMSHDDHMMSPTTPVTTLREIEQVEEDGYQSESESGSYSDVDFGGVGGGSDKIDCVEVVSDVGGVFDERESGGSMGSRVCVDGGTESSQENSPIREDDIGPRQDDYKEELNDLIADLPPSSSTARKKSHSQEERPPTNHAHSHYRRHFSSPQVLRQANIVSPIQLYDLPTQHGHYTPVTVELDPFAIDFQKGTEENLSLTDVRETTLKSTAYTRQVCDSVESPSRDHPPMAVETLEMHTQVSCTQTRHRAKPDKQVVEPVSNTLLEPEHQIPAHAFSDPCFLQFIKRLGHEPTISDYICYKLRSIGDEIDQKYDDKLNHALDDIFMEAVKSSVSWERFSAISKRLLLEGQKVQDGIMLITCFGRRLAEMVPNVGDTVTGFTQLVVDTYASELLLSIGGWGRLVESYHQVETTLQDYEFDYEDYPEYGYNMRRNVPEHPPIPDPQPPASTDVSPPTQSHPTIIQVNPPPVCQVTFDPPPVTHRLRRVMSVEVLFAEGDSTEHAQSSHHDNTSRMPSLNRSVSTSSLEVTSAHFQRQFFPSDYLSPSPTKPVSEWFQYQETHFEETRLRYSRRGSVASVCSQGSAIRIVGGDHHGDVDRPVIVSKGSSHHLDIPDGQYLDLNLDTPSPSRSSTLRGDQPSNTHGRHPTTRGWSSLTLPLVAAAVAVGVVGVLGFYYLRRK